MKQMGQVKTEAPRTPIDLANCSACLQEGSEIIVGETACEQHQNLSSTPPAEAAHSKGKLAGQEERMREQLKVYVPV